MTITKAGIPVAVVASDPSWKLRDENKFRQPCGHFGMVVRCTCKLRERQCRTCLRVFMAFEGRVYEIRDPHVKPAPGPNGEAF